MSSTNDSPFSGENNLHILHIASGDLWAGAEVMLFTLASQLSARDGVTVSVILMNPGTLEAKLSETGIKTYVIDESTHNSWQILKHINRLVKKLTPDVIHTHRSKENTLGSLVGRWQSTPSLRTVHGASEHKAALLQLPKRAIMTADWLCGRFLQRYIVAVAPDLADKLRHQFPQHKLRTIENGIDTERLIAAASAADTAERSNIAIGIVGRLVDVKRIDLFIDTAVRLKRHYAESEIDFHIYGDGPLRQTLAAQITSLGAQDYIHLEGHSATIDQHIQALDVLVMTSDHEGLPMTLLEAMCLGTPIVAHATGGIPRLLDQGRCGSLVTEQTAEAFAAAIIGTLDDEATRLQQTRDAQQRVIEHYSSARTADDYLSLYDDCRR